MDKYSKTLLREGVIGQEIVVRKDVCDIDIAKIRTSRNQPRLNIDRETLADLIRSIKKHGVIEPILVRPKDDQYEIVAGQRRFEAAKEAGLTKLPCIVREMSDDEAFITALTENIQREDLSPVDEANSYRIMLERGMAKSEREIAKLLGVSHTRIQQKMNLLKLEPEIRNRVATRVATRKDEGKITEAHARRLLRVKDPKKRLDLFNQVTQKGLSVRELEQKVERIINPVPKKPTPPSRLIYQDETIKVRSTTSGFDIKVACQTEDELVAHLKRLVERMLTKETLK